MSDLRRWGEVHVGPFNFREQLQRTFVRIVRTVVRRGPDGAVPTGQAFVREGYAGAVSDYSDVTPGGSHPRGNDDCGGR